MRNAPTILRALFCTVKHYIGFRQYSWSWIINHYFIINPLKTKRRLLYLKTQFVPRTKHFSSRL